MGIELNGNRVGTVKLNNTSVSKVYLDNAQVFPEIYMVHWLKAWVELPGIPLITTEFVEYGNNASTVASLGDIYDEGYELDYISPENGNINITSNVSIFVYQKLKKFTVTFIRDWDNSVIGVPQEVVWGGNATFPTSVQINYGTGWVSDGYSGGSYTDIKSNVTIRIKRKPKTYTVIWKDWNDTIINSQLDIPHGSSAIFPVISYPTGYVADGYTTSDNSEMLYTYITGDVTFIIKRKPIEYTLTINPLPTGVSAITVTRQSNNEVLTTNAKIYHHEILVISATATTGYNNPRINGKNQTSDTIVVSSNLTANSYVEAGSVKSFMLTRIPQDNSKVSSFRVQRTSSPLQGAFVGIISGLLPDTDSVTVYYGDNIQLTAVAETGYSTPTVNPSSTFIVTSNITVSTTAGSVLTYKVTVPTKPENSVDTFIVKANSVSGPDITNGSYVQHFSTIYIEATAATGYNAPTLKVNNVEFTSGTKHTVTGLVNIEVIPGVVKTYTVRWWREWIDRNTNPVQSLIKTESGVTHGSNVTLPSVDYGTEYQYSHISPTNADKNITSTTDITVHRKYKTFTVTWADWNGTTLKTQTVNYGFNATHPSDPTRTGYNFTGWSTNANNIIANRTITAQYAIKTYTVTWKDHNGTILKTQTVSHGSDGTHPTNPTRTGYNFTGWSHAATNVTANRTITAQYERLRYYVKWMRDWNNTIIKDEYVYWGESAVAPSLQDMQFYEGYELDGMSADHTYITSDLTIYVTQKLKTYKLTIGSLTGVNTITVRLNTSNGTVLSNNANITHGSILYITASASTGYNAPTISGSPVTVSGNVTASNYVTRGSVRSFKLTKNAAPTGVSAFSVTRTSSPLQGASTGTLNTNATIYYNDKLTLSATASTGYNNPSVSPSSSVTVTGNVTASVTAGTKKQYEVKWVETYTGQNQTIYSTMVYHGDPVTTGPPNYPNPGTGYEVYEDTPPATITGPTTILVHKRLKTYKLTIGSKTGVGTITVRLNTSGGTILSNNANITHGDKLYITATAASGYNAPTVSGSPVTVTGNVTASNYVTAGSQQITTVTLTATVIHVRIDAGPPGNGWLTGVIKHNGPSNVDIPITITYWEVFGDLGYYHDFSGYTRTITNSGTEVMGVLTYQGDSVYGYGIEWSSGSVIVNGVKYVINAGGASG